MHIGMLKAESDLLQRRRRKVGEDQQTGPAIGIPGLLHSRRLLRILERNHMVQAIALYGITTCIFLILDFIGIRFLIRPVFDRNVGHLLADPLRLGPAAIFYLAYVAGLVWMVSWPALRANDPVQALIGGMVLGLLCYGTYEMTNYATLAAWSWEQVIIDGLWGTFLTGFCAWAGVAAMSGRLS